MKVLPFDPLELLVAALGSVVGRVLGFFVACWIGFAAGGWASGHGVDGGLAGTLGLAGDGGWFRWMATVPAAWFASIWMVLLAPWQLVFLLVLPWFAFRIIGDSGDDGRVRDGGRLAALEAVRAFLLLAGGGVGFLEVARLAAGAAVLLAGAWGIERWREALWERRFRVIEEANRRKREARRRRGDGGT